MKKLLENIGKKIYRMRGYEIGLTKLKIYEGPLPQSIIRTRSTYSPWETDEAFQRIYDLVQGFTKVGPLRCYELWQLVEETACLEGDIVEVGVWKGGSGALMAYRESQYHSDTTVYLCDTFTGVVKAGDQDNRYQGGEHRDTSLRIVQDLVYERLKLKNVKILPGIFPDDTAGQITTPIKLCHIDVDVYESARQVTEYVWDHLVVGGVIVYDDYGFSGTQGVTKYVNSLRGRADRLVLHNINGHGILVKIR